MNARPQKREERGAEHKTAGLVDNLVSIIVPCTGSATHLGRALDSVEQQTYQLWEAVLVANGLDHYGYDWLRMRMRSEPKYQMIESSIPLGASEARNAGIKRARGRYIAFLDADDWWDPQKLQMQVAQLQFCGNPFIACAYRKVRFDGARGGIVYPDRELTHANLLRTCSVGCSTVVVDRAKVKSMEFRPGRREDYALWLTLARRYGPGVGLGQCLTYYQEPKRTQGLIKRVRVASATWRLFRYEEGYGFASAWWRFLVHSSHGLRRFLK